MKKMFMAVIALMMTISASAQFYIYFSDGTVSKVDSISLISPDEQGESEDPDTPITPTVTGVTVTPATLNLTLGEEYRLACTFTPSGAKGTVTWESSNPEVVEVNDKGVVTALDYGTANVTATCGEYKGVCAVAVKNYFETLQFTNAVLWDLDTLKYGGEINEIEASSGEKYNCYLAEVEMRVFSDGFYINNGGSLDGVEKGSFISVKAPMYYSTPSQNGGRGVVFSLGDWYVVDVDSVLAKVGEPTKFDEANYKKYMNDAVQAQNRGDNAAFATALKAAGKCFSGAEINTYEFHSTTEGYGSDAYYPSYIPDGKILYGQFTFTGKEGASEYMYGLDYSYFEFLPLDNTNYYWGCDLKIDEKGTYSWGDKDIKWLDKIVYEYGVKPAEAQRKMEPISVTVMKIDQPEMAERINKELEKHKVKQFNLGSK